MQMRALHAEVDDPEVLAPCRGQRGPPDRLIDTAAAQATDRADHAQRDVHRVARVVERPLRVRLSGPILLARATSAGPLAAVLLEQRELSWLGVSGALHVEKVARMGRIYNLISAYIN